MRAMPVVDAEPFFGFRSDLVQSFKDVHIQNRFPVTAVEAFDKAVLHRLTRLDKFQTPDDGLPIPPEPSESRSRHAAEQHNDRPIARV